MLSPKRLFALLAVPIALLVLCASAWAVDLSVPGIGPPVGTLDRGPVTLRAPTAAGPAPGVVSAGVGGIGVVLGDEPTGSPQLPDPGEPPLHTPTPRAASNPALAIRAPAGRSALGSRNASAAAPGAAPWGSAASDPVSVAPGVSLRNPDHAAAPRHSVVERIITRIPGEFLAALCAALLAALGFAIVWVREWRRSRRARQEALVDPLTGIANRLAFGQRLSHEWRRARRYQRELGLLMLDLDDLKQINDNEGHAAGDDLLCEVASLISTNTRQSDLAARLGGDEFVVLCPETSADGLGQLAGKLCERIEAQGIAISIGRAELEETDDSPEDVLARADVEMYRNKDRRRAVRQGAENRRRRSEGRPRPTARPDLASSGFWAPRAS